MKYPVYPQYKDSGVAWLGEVPEHWEVKKVKYLAKVKIGITYSPDDIADESDGVLVLRASNVQNGKLSFHDNVFVSNKINSDDFVRAGDILICSRNGSEHLVGKCAYIDSTNVGYTFGAFMSVVRSNIGLFLYYFFNSEVFKAQSGLFKTSTINQLTTNTLQNLMAALPSPSEQTAIADFLDRETGRIDTLVAKKRELVELLKEKRSALISRTVTRGLPADAAREFGLEPQEQFAQSGVDWLGDIPESWKLKAIKWESAVQRGASPRPIDDPVYFDDEGEYAWVRISDVTASGMYLEKTEQKLSEVGASLSVKLTPGKLFLSIAGSVGKPCITNIKCCIHDGFVYFPRWKGEQRFLYYIFASGEPYKGLGKMGTQLNLNTDTVGGIVIGLPKPNEQTAIADFLDRETARIDKLTEKVETAIARLQEYRSALITAAVTGKIDVREYV